MVVVQDRYIDSSVVYQGLARGLGEDRIEAMSMWASGGAVPDLTVVLDRDPIARHQVPDRMERELADRAAVVREGFLVRARREPERYVVIDAARTMDEVAADVSAVVGERLRRVRPALPA